MARWKVSIPSWECEVEADDEGEALMQADGQYSFMGEAEAEEMEPDEDEEDDDED